jgi:hypothetical protein
VSVTESQTFAGEPIDVRRRNAAHAVVTTEIAVAEIVGQDEDDVGFRLALLRPEQGVRGERGQEGAA